MIVIPMAGLSSRFFKAGFTEPKYILKAHGKTLFDHSVISFEKYFDSEKFLFIIRDVYQTQAFVEKSANALGISDFEIVVLKEETRGQAETVTLGLAEVEHQGSITVFNIDTFRPDFKYPEPELLADGFLEVFRGEGDNWSFVKPVKPGSTQVAQTTEKNPISDLCCTGLYYFNHIADYKAAYNFYLSLPKEQWEKGELYVAPLYNFLISNNKDIRFNLINRNKVIFCGTPDEYENFLSATPAH